MCKNAEVASAEPTFEEAVKSLTDMIDRAPRHREIYLRLLSLCAQRQSLHKVEREVEKMPEFPLAAQTPYRLIRTLANAGGLCWLELGKDGELLSQDEKAGLSADEIEDLTFEYAVVTTLVGEQVADDLAPEKRLRSLMGGAAGYLDAYVDVLGFCQQSRSFNEVESFLRTCKSASAMGSGSQAPHPSYFVDMLERAGGLVWNNGWKTTSVGEKLLQTFA